MKERPILFSGPMVRALLDGNKTQTRRALRGFCPPNRPEYDSETGRLEWFNGDEVVVGMRCPYGQPGDRLWVREAWRTSKVADELKPSQLVGGSCSPIWYEAQNEVPFHPSDFGKLRPSMFMPRWGSRIMLEITGVRVERLQDISDDDCLAEGIAQVVRERLPSIQQCGEYDAIDVDPVAEYRALWETINGSGAWDVNPWVWVVEFRRLS